ncbi:MAG: hypothetical protein WA372_03250, partial [Candidatus Sulfotelmatobacter sp.]
VRPSRIRMMPAVTRIMPRTKSTLPNSPMDRMIPPQLNDHISVQLESAFFTSISPKAAPAGQPKAAVTT